MPPRNTNAYRAEFVLTPLPGGHSTALRGRLHFVDPAARRARAVVVGTFDGHFVDVHALADDGDAPALFEVLDAAGDDQGLCYDEFFDGDDFNEHVSSLAPGECANFLYLKMMEIEPDHRGLGLGLFFMRELFERGVVPEGTVVAMQPWAQGRAGDPAAEAAGTKKLAAMWKEAGFRKLRNSAFYATFL